MGDTTALPAVLRTLFTAVETGRGVQVPVCGLAEQGAQLVGVLVGRVEPGVVVVLGERERHARVHPAGRVRRLRGDDGARDRKSVV